MSWAVRSCSRASTRRPSRRSHSPYSRCARASSGRSRVRPSRSIASRYRSSASAAVAQQRPAAGLDAERGIVARGLGHHRQPIERVAGELVVSQPGGRLDQLRQGPQGAPRIERVGGGLPGRRRGLLVVGEAVVQDRRRPVGEGRRRPLPAGGRLLDRARDRGAGLGLAALHRPQQQHDVGREPVPGPRGHARALRRHRAGAGEVAHPRAGNPHLGQEQRQLGERADVADELDLAGGDRVKTLVVPDRAAGPGGHPAPAQDLLDRDAGEHLRCSLEGRRGGGVPIGDQQGQALEGEIERARAIRRGRQRQHRAADLQQHVPVAVVPRVAPFLVRRRSGSPRPRRRGRSRARGRGRAAPAGGPPQAARRPRRGCDRRRRRPGRAAGPPGRGRIRRAVPPRPPRAGRGRCRSRRPAG